MAAVAAAVAPIHSQADTLESEPPAAAAGGELEEITVTATRFLRPVDSRSATRFELPIAETPQSVSVITSDLLSTFNVTNLRGITKFSAGLDNRAELPGEQTSMTARGFALDFFDGFKLNGASFIPVQPIDAVAIERVEVLKGPNGALHGRNSYGGVVNYITRAPSTDSSSRVSLSVGEDSFGRLETDFNGGTQDGSVMARLPASWEKKSSVNDPDSRLLTAAPAVRWVISPDTEVNLLGIYQNWASRAEVGLPASFVDFDSPELGANDWFNDNCQNQSCSAPPDSLRGIRTGPSWQSYEAETSQLLGKLSHRIGSSHSLDFSVNALESDLVAVQGYVQGVITSDLRTHYWSDRVGVEQSGWSGEAAISGDVEWLSRTHKYYVGADYREYRKTTDETNDLALTDTLGPISLGPLISGEQSIDDLLRGLGIARPNHVVDQQERDERTYSGLGAQVLLRIADPLDLLLGGRWERAEIDVVQRAITSDGFAFDDRISESKFLSRAALTWHFVPQAWNAYVSYMEGYVPQFGETRGGGSLAPETGEQIEVGVKGRLFADRLLLTVAGFEIKRKGISIFDPSNQPGEEFVVGGLAQTNRGIEIEAVGEIARGINVAFASHYIDAQFEESADTFFSGQTAPAVPETKYSGFINYQALGGRLTGVSLALGVTYVGDQEGYFGDWPLESYTTVDASVRYQLSERLQIGLAVENAFDEVYFNSIGFWDGCCSSFGNGRRVTLRLDANL
jgi:iron complex outermembrane receptor protein